MPIVNMHDAKTRLSKLAEAIESGAETEIILARAGRPVARLVPLSKPPAVRLGVARGRYAPLDLEAFRAADDDVAALFAGAPGPKP